MRFIHTADWHLGNQMHDIDRQEEAQAFLRWLKNQIMEKNADTLIVVGDIFDTANPSAKSQWLYYTFLSWLKDTCCKNVVIVGGNHDSAVMLDSSKRLLEVLHIHVVGSINNLSADDMCFELWDADNTVCGICMAVPFVREVELRALLTEKVDDGDMYGKAYRLLYEQVYAAAEKLRAGRDIPIIATGHLYAADLEGRLADVAGNVKTDDGVKVLDVLGTLGNVPPSVFPPVDYVALGHIHYTTMVAKNPAVRYSGSPFVMGFDETTIPHFVLCGDLSADGAGHHLTVEKIETPTTFVYRRISGTLAEIETALRTFASLKSEKPVYLELCYKKEIGVNAQDFLEEAIAALPENVTVASWKIYEHENVFSEAGFSSFDAVEVKNLDDWEIFTQLILSRSGLDPQDDEAKSVLARFLPYFLQVAEEV